MKYSNYFGVIFSVMVIGVCFLPWVYIESINTTVTGLQTGVTNFGKPGLMNIFLTFIAILKRSISNSFSNGLHCEQYSAIFLCFSV